MSYETSSEFQIRYLLKSVAVYLLFMRRIASISMLAVVSALSASAATVLFDFNSSLLPETPAKTVSVTDSGSGFVATLATASSSANLGSASSAASGDWVSSGTSFDTQGLDSFMENQISFGNSWQTFISGPKGSSLSLTISGLVAGASYQIALVTGCPFEGAGAWNSLVTSNTYGSADPSIGANSQTIQARTPMNILFLLGKFPSVGGVETVTAILANEFSARGHAVHVVSFEQVTETPTPALDNRVTLHRLSYPVSSRANRDALRDILATCRIDVIINQWCLPFHVTRLCRKAMKGLPCRLLAVHHNAPDCNARLEGLRMRMARTGNPVNRAFLRLLLKGCAMATGASLRYVYAHSDRYILLSDSFHQAFRNITGLKDTGKLLTIPNPITVENPEFRYDPALKKKEVLFVGRLEPNQKRVSRVLETWALLEPRFPDWTLRLVGDGPEKRSLQEFCAEHRLEHVSFEGFQNPAPYYEQASLLLLTSEYEGFGLVIVEGMSFGVSPIVYGSFSAAYDLVDHGKDGCILPAASGFQAHRMAEMAAGLMREPADLHAMARNAIAKSRKFTREHIIPQWEKAFRPDAS